MTDGRGGQEAILGDLPLFAALDHEALVVLAAATEPTRVKGGDVLMAEGDPADAVYVVVSGRLRAFVATDDGESAVGDRQWAALDDLIDIGYRHAGERLEAWAGEGHGLPWE